MKILLHWNLQIIIKKLILKKLMKRSIYIFLILKTKVRFLRKKKKKTVVKP